MKITDNAQAVVKNMIARFQSGDISPIVDVTTLKLSRPNAPIPALKWSLCNQVIAYMTTGEFDCRGFRQWQQVNRYVVKGAHAAYILGPVTIKDEQDPTRVKLVAFKSIPVFPLSMTDGQPLPEPENLAPAALPPLADVAAAWGIPLNYVPFDGRRYGQYSQRGAKKIIKLATHDEATFFHELAHAAHAILGTMKGRQNANDETIAEFTACVLMQVYGLQDTTGNTWEYIKNYNPENPVKAIMNALDTIGKVIDLILTTAQPVEVIEASNTYYQEFDEFTDADPGL